MFMSFWLSESFLFRQKRSPSTNHLTRVTLGTLFWGQFWVLFNNTYKSEIPKAFAEQNFWLLEWFWIPSVNLSGQTFFFAVFYFLPWLLTCLLICFMFLSFPGDGNTSLISPGLPVLLFALSFFLLFAFCFFFQVVDEEVTTGGSDSDLRCTTPGTSPHLDKLSFIILPGLRFLTRFLKHTACPNQLEWSIRVMFHRMPDQMPFSGKIQFSARVGWRTRGCWLDRGWKITLLVLTGPVGVWLLWVRWEQGNKFHMRGLKKQCALIFLPSCDWDQAWFSSLDAAGCPSMTVLHNGPCSSPGELWFTLWHPIIFSPLLP